jgi:hypothetical protein
MIFPLPAFFIRRFHRFTQIIVLICENPRNLRMKCRYLGQAHNPSTLNSGNVQIFRHFLGLCGKRTFRVGRVTPCAPSVAKSRVRRAEDCPPYQFASLVCHLQNPTIFDHFCLKMISRPIFTFLLEFSARQSML